MPRTRVSIYSEDYRWMLQRLRTARNAAGLSQKVVAARMGTEQTTLSKLERGAVRMDLVDLANYLKAIDADPVRFMAEFNHQLSRRG